MREWQTSQKEAAAFNSKVMNAIFNAVSMEEFKRDRKSTRLNSSHLPTSRMPSSA